MSAVVGKYKNRWYVTGGNTITTVTINGQLYKVHTFTSSGSLVVAGLQGVFNNQDVLNGLIAECEILAGGGGAGSGSTAGFGGGGGGGGGIRQAILLGSGSYPIVIGAGGPGSTGLNSPTTGFGTNGSNSTGFGLTAVGGGYGGYCENGGPSTGVGNNGGCGGGGGAITLSAYGSPGAGTQGSIGRMDGIGGTSLGFSNMDGGSVYIGVGGNNGATTPGTAGTANTGNGGNGGNGGTLGGAGGSGRVIVRYQWYT